MTRRLSACAAVLALCALVSSPAAQIVYPTGAIIWEYMFPLFAGAGPNPANAVYRAYRVPYDWIPQLRKPSEQRVTPPPLGEFKVASSEQKTR